MSSTIKQAVEALKQRIADAYSAIVAKGGTLPATQDSTNLPSAIGSIPSGGSGLSTDGTTFSTPPSSVLDFIAGHGVIADIDDNTITEISRPGLNVFGSSSARLCTYTGSKLRMSAVTHIRAGFLFDWTTGLREIYFDSLATSNITRFTNACEGVRKIFIPKITTLTGITFFPSAGALPNLIDITLGENFTTSQSLVRWSPTNALDSTSSSLVEVGESFANNLEKLLYNIREHIAANLRDDVGNLTITFSSAVGAAIDADTDTKNAFPSNWTIAY